MAALTELGKAELLNLFMRRYSIRRDSLALTKADLVSAINGLDAFLSSNETAINQAITQPTRGILTTKQKAELLMFVIDRRYLEA